MSIPDLGSLLDQMYDAETPKAKRVQIICNSGYQGLKRYFPGADTIVPFEKPKGRKLSETEKEYNKTLSKRIENAFARVKNWNLISGRYGGTAEEFNDDFNAICM